MIFPNVFSMGAERIDSVRACPDDLIFSNNVLCSWSFPFFPNISVGSILMWKLCMDALKATQLPYLTKSIFLYQRGNEFRAVQPLIFEKGWLALVQCCAAMTEIPAPLSLCAVQMGIEYFCGEGCVWGYKEMSVKAWLPQAVPIWWQQWCLISRTNVVSWVL